MVLVDSASSTEIAVGDPARGRKIFHEHPVASCIRCHQVEGKGQFVGPYMDGIAAHKGADYIRESLLNPQAKMADGFPSEVSPMPPMGVFLKPQEIEDVLAFLLTLKTPPKPGTIVKPKQISYE
jgi:mono/diheme cytochrome c family protein